MIIHPYSWIEIDRAALMHNVSLFKSFVGRNAFLGVVVKSNAYGHGLHLITQLLDDNDDVSWFCVGYLSEALQLRELGVKKPLLVMSCIDDDPLKACNLNIHFIVGDMQKLTTLSYAGQKTNAVFDIHLKIDTGLSRFGVIPQEACDMIKVIKQMKKINLAGLCTHFAESQNADQSFTQYQIDCFEKVIALLDQRPAYIHASNSAATIMADIMGVNMFRVGLGIYGYWSNDFVQQAGLMRTNGTTLKPVLTFKTRIMEIKLIKKGMTIGYDRTFTAQKDTLIALLPIGYYDGYDFRLCNNSLVYINNQPFPLIGKVAMNTLIIDISNDTSLLVGAEVMIVGDKPGITAHDFCERIQEPNPRKIVTLLGAHIVRIAV